MAAHDRRPSLVAEGALSRSAGLCGQKLAGAPAHIVGVGRAVGPAARANPDPICTGADHVTFRLATRTDLDAWAERLDEFGVTCSPSPTASRRVPCLRDPDEIQLESSHRDNHPVTEETAP